jgi:hypothetical protein
MSKARDGAVLDARDIAISGRRLQLDARRPERLSAASLFIVLKVIE